MTTSVTEMSRWCYVQTDQENPTQSVEVVEIMEDFQEEVTFRVEIQIQRKAVWDSEAWVWRLSTEAGEEIGYWGSWIPQGLHI